MRSLALFLALSVTACCDDPTKIVFKPTTMYIVPPEVVCPESSVPIPNKPGDKQDALADYLTDQWSTLRICRASAQISNASRERMIERAKKDEKSVLVEEKSQ